jgi:hypothetical protein
MAGSSPFPEFFISHHIGDYLLQTDFQALNKHGGLGRDRTARRALGQHGLSYTAAFVPALAVVARRRGLGRALSVAAAITLPHVAIDDGRMLHSYMRAVKGIKGAADPGLARNVDQSMHMVCLWLAAKFAARG